MTENVKLKLELLPDKPGCYLMKDSNSRIIYVGKAKNLKNRVRSYFHGSHNAKTTKLVSEIADFDYIITSSNKESFVLEINLIKEHDPKYNILLKDDKTYPFIALTNEKHPRLLITREPRKRNNARYFGPYPNVREARNTLNILNQLFPFRKCRIMPKKECLYYHLKQCLGPCINKSDIDYTNYKKEVTDFLNGKIDNVVNKLEELMNEASLNLEFEKAKEYRDEINSIKNTTQSQLIDLNSDLDADYIGTYLKDDNLAIHILIMRRGNIIGNYSTILPIISDEYDTFNGFMTQYYTPNITPKVIYLNDNYLDETLPEIIDSKFISPQKGAKVKVLDMANINAEKDLENRYLIKQNKALRNIETIEELGKLLGINTPYTIESFDNSNLFGEYPISALVVYKNGKAVPNLFRKYHVKTVVGANDYETMKEVVYRRYLRLKLEDKELPDLILMDGGQIQVHACQEVLKTLNIDIPVAGIQKDEHHKAKLLYYNEKEISLSKNSNVYLLIANISERVHEFAISFFRSTKAKGLFSSKLDNIEGLGKARKDKLLKHFITIDAIKEASIEDITKIGIPKDVAIRIKEKLEANI